MLDIGIEFFATQARSLMLSLQLQETKVYGIDEPSLVARPVSLHSHFPESRGKMLHASFRYSFQHRRHLGVARRCTQFTVNFVRKLLLSDAAKK